MLSKKALLVFVKRYFLLLLREEANKRDSLISGGKRNKAGFCWDKDDFKSLFLHLNGRLDTLDTVNRSCKDFASSL